MVVDWAVVWGIVGPAAAGLVTWLKTRKPNQAAIQAAVSQARAESAVADAEGKVYALLTKRMEALEARAERVEDELAHERKRARRLELHINKLEDLMRKAGMTPPSLDD